MNKPETNKMWIPITRTISNKQLISGKWEEIRGRTATAAIAMAANSNSY